MVNLFRTQKWAGAREREALREAFQSAQPYPHVVIDEFLPAWELEQLQRQTPKREHLKRSGTSYETKHEHGKIGVSKRVAYPPAFITLAKQLESPEALSWFSDVSGIPGLHADPKLIGAGIHWMDGDGRLGIHSDFNKMPGNWGTPVGGMFRRLNLLIYLSPWSSEWGGRLELWSPDMQRCETQIVPLPGRAVLFETQHTHWHGVEQIRAPRARVSFSAYYYTAEQPAGWKGTNLDTVFTDRPKAYSGT